MTIVKLLTKPIVHCKQDPYSKKHLSASQPTFGLKTETMERDQDVRQTLEFNDVRGNDGGKSPPQRNECRDDDVDDRVLDGIRRSVVSTNRWSSAAAT